MTETPCILLCDTSIQRVGRTISNKSTRDCIFYCGHTRKTPTFTIRLPTVAILLVRRSLSACLSSSGSMADILCSSSVASVMSSRVVASSCCRYCRWSWAEAECSRTSVVCTRTCVQHYLPFFHITQSL